MFGATDEPFLFECLLESHADTAGQELLAVSPQDRPASSAEIALMAAIGQSLRETGYPALRNVEVQVSGGDVVLTGHVPTYHMKQLAQATVQQFLRVRGLTNNIEVINGR